MKIYNENKTQELNEKELDLEKGYLRAEKLFIAHHEAIEAQEAVYQERIVEEEGGGISIYKYLQAPEVKAKKAYDEYEDIQVYIPYTEEELKVREIAKLRRRREIECFPIINRGQLWYETLTEKQKTELKNWYSAWLNVTETLIIPDKPEWLIEVEK